MTDNEIEDFYNRCEARYRGPANAHRPAIASFVRDIKTLGFAQRMSTLTKRYLSFPEKKQLP